MANYIKTCECGDNRYHISVGGNGKDVYYSKSSKTGGASLKGVKCYKNELRLTKTNKAIMDVELCECIANSKKSSGFCFITTVVCKGMGKSDDCYELETLRHLRDAYLLTNDEGIKLVATYYDIAPPLAIALERRADFLPQASRLFEAYIVTCCQAIKRGEIDEATNIYQAFVAEVKTLCDSQPSLS